MINDEDEDPEQINLKTPEDRKKNKQKESGDAGAAQEEKKFFQEI